MKQNKNEEDLYYLIQSNFLRYTEMENKKGQIPKEQLQSATFHVRKKKKDIQKYTCISSLLQKKFKKYKAETTKTDYIQGVVRNVFPMYNMRNGVTLSL